MAPGAVRADGVVYAPRRGTPTLLDAYRTRTIPPLPEPLADIIRAGGSPGENDGGDRDRHHGDAAGSPFIAKGERLDVEVCLAAMQPNGASVNETQPSVILSLLQQAMHPDDVIDFVVNRTMEMAGRARLGWSRDVEVKCVTERVKSGLKKLHSEYDPSVGTIPPWLAGEFHLAWATALEQGGRPQVSRNACGFYVRAFGRTKEPGLPEDAKGDEPGEARPGEDAGEAAPPKRYRFPLFRFGDMRPGTEPNYLVDELIPLAGLVVVYGAPKSGKSFWALDLVLHVTLAWEYRERAVQQGTVVYCAFEGAHGYKKRCEAFRRHHGLTDEDPPLFIVPGRADLIKDHAALVQDMQAQLGAAGPVRCVVLDTLNKSLIGSESKDVDMANYIAAAEYIQKKFDCVVIIVHHHGIDESRPRGHTSLRGAVDAQIKITRDEQNNIIAEIEDIRDGPEGAQIMSRLAVVDVGSDVAGKPLTSAAVESIDPIAGAGGRMLPKLRKNQRTFFLILQGAPHGLTLTEWNDQAIQAGLGVTRRADLHDLRTNLKNRGLVQTTENRWFVVSDFRNCVE